MLLPVNYSIAGEDVVLSFFISNFAKKQALNNFYAGSDSRITMEGHDTGHYARYKRTVGKGNDHCLYWF
ncbi:hypothetical protein GCM10027043_27620 [Ferruginibacter profundus]